MEEESQQTQQQGHHEEDVAAFVLFQVGGEKRLVTHQELVDEVETGNPVSVCGIAIALNVVLTTGKVPHEVTPIHEIDLVVDEETHVLDEGRLACHATVNPHVFPLEVRPLLVGADVAAVGAIHAGEEHAEFGGVDVVAFVVDDFIAVGFIFRCLDDAGPYRCPFFIEGNTVFPFHVGHEGLSVEERAVAVLFAVEVAAQGKNIFGRVLVHGGVGRRTYDDDGIGGVSDEDDQHRHQYHVEQAYGQLFLVEKEEGQRQRYEYADEYFAADEGQSHQYHTDEEREAQAVDVVLLVGLVDAPGDAGDDDEEVDNDTRVEGHT